MPGQRRTARPRTQGSWQPRLAGLAGIVIVALAATVAYLLAFHPGSGRPPGPLPSRVASTQTVGLLAQAGPGQARDGSMIQLLSSGRQPGFQPVDLAEQADGQPEWIADLMADGSYIFIYLPTSDCLGSAGKAQLTVQRCDLSSRQRWRRLGNGTAEDGHDFYQFANVADRKCLGRAGASGGGNYAAALTACGAQPASQLFAFWWTGD
jgi:hypothetical protein